MAQVTIELNTLLKVKEFELFDFNYPVPNQKWKIQFENAFIEHYRFNEIGVETADRFKQRLASRLNLIMPTYVERYSLLEKISDPLIIEKTVKKYSEDQGNVKVESGSNKQESENKNTLTTQTDTLSNMLVSDYPQHINIENDVPTRREQNNLKGSNVGDEIGSIKATETLTKNTNDTREKQGQEEVVKTGNLKEIEHYLQLKQDIIYQVIQDCKTLFILVY